VGEGADIVVRGPVEGEKDWIEGTLRASWGSTTIVTRGRAHDAASLPALVAVREGELVGLATMRFAEDGCEMVSLDALKPREGVGSALLSAAGREARRRGTGRLWLVTTNDNLDAMRFYQRRGMQLVAVHPGAVEEARRLKPGIPPFGEHGIPLRDEIEFELRLDDAGSAPPG
jgi:GNAT superfamily N-acetyltransferase